jgi:hypothetical protein
MSLATIKSNGAVPAGPDMKTGLAEVARANGVAMKLDEMWRVAEILAASGLCAAKTPEQAFTMLMLCQADGLHPMTAMRRYHLMDIRGRVVPTMRSDAAQGEMQARGWLITPLVRTGEEARAEFSHPAKCPNGFVVSATLAEYKAAGLTTKDTWKSYPADMLWARLVMRACRTLDPGIIAGVYSPEEIEDQAYLESPPARHAAEDVRAVELIRRADLELPGQADGAYDDRSALSVLDETAAAVHGDKRELVKHLLTQAVAFGYLDPPAPTKMSAALPALTRIYSGNREWFRRAVAEWCAAVLDMAPEAEPAPTDATLAQAAIAWEPGADG